MREPRFYPTPEAVRNFRQYPRNDDIDFKPVHNPIMAVFLFMIKLLIEPIIIIVENLLGILTKKEWYFKNWHLGIGE